MLSPLSTRARDELLSRIRAEVARRRGAATQSALRRSQIRDAYRPLHPALWTLSEDFLHEDFVALVRAAEGGGAPTPEPNPHPNPNPIPNPNPRPTPNPTPDHKPNPNPNPNPDQA